MIQQALDTNKQLHKVVNLQSLLIDTYLHSLGSLKHLTFLITNVFFFHSHMELDTQFLKENQSTLLLPQPFLWVALRRMKTPKTL